MICKKRIFGALLVFLALTTVFLAGCNLFSKPKEDQVATPAIYPPGGDYIIGQNVSMFCETRDATIRYTTDGTEPTESSTEYIYQIPVNTETTFKVKAFKAGLKPSATVTVTYTFSAYVTVPTPYFTPSGGHFTFNKKVAIHCFDEEATIRYTIDGAEPTEVSTEYTEPILVKTATTIKAKAFREGWTASETASADYTIDVAIHGNMIFVPGGTFIMGRTSGAGHGDELPAHSVTLNSFYICEYEVTQAEFDEYIPCSGIWENYGGAFGNNYAANKITWYSIIKYCNLRSIGEGLSPAYSIAGSTNPADWGDVPVFTLDSVWDAAICNFGANGYRLPTEAEWEYAARGASNEPDYPYSGSDDIDAVAWYQDNSGGIGHLVGTKAPNGLGIYDMTGNMAELCWDWMHSSYYSVSPSNNPTGPATGNSRVLRGGSKDYNAWLCRLPSRMSYNPYGADSNIGFRVCRSSM